MNNSPSPYLNHMRDSAQEVWAYASSHSFEEFEGSDWDQAAAIRNLEIIGEAATKIPKEFRTEHSEIPWQDIIDFRNVAIHQYMEVDIQIVWEVIQNDIPILLKLLNNLLEKWFLVIICLHQFVKNYDRWFK